MNVRRLAPVGTLFGCAALSACAGPLSTLDPAGPAAASIAEIWIVMLVGGTALFLLVMALFAFAFWKPGSLSSEAARSRWILWGGLAMPTVVLAALLLFALTRGEGLLAHPGAEGLLRVEARAARWRWTFAYPDAPAAGETIGVLHVPAGRPVDVTIVSDDVIHSFWIPRLAGKMDAIPGHANTLRIEADVAGRYAGICSEYCGFGHAGMGFEVLAHEPDLYAAALAEAAEAAR